MPHLTHEMIDNKTVHPTMNGRGVFRWATAKMPAFGDGFTWGAALLRL